MKRKNYAAILAVGTLSACSVGPQYQRPELDVPTVFRSSQEEVPSETSLADMQWWDFYQDETLQELIKTALVQNRDVKIAAARVTEARALVGVSRLAQFPQIGITAGGERGRFFQSEQFATANLFSAQAQISYEVDLWQRLASLSEAARANLLATEYARYGVRMSLVSAVATAYFNLISLDQQIEITKRTIATRERFAQLTQSKLRHGASSSLDVSRADASLAAAQAALPDLQREAEQAENQIQILLGKNPGPILRKRIDLQSIPMPRAIPAGLPSTLLERRPDIRQAEYNLVGATANIRSAKAALFPTISLTGAYGSQSLEFSDLFSGPTRVWSFGLNLLQPLLDAERNGYRVEATEARKEQALLAYQNIVGQAFREVADALAAQRWYVDSLKAQETQVTALRQASSRVMRRYEVGYSSYFEVIDADSSLFTAELLLVQAYRNNLLSLVQLYMALGGGWDA